MSDPDKTLYAYCRVSSEDQVDRYSLDSQEEDAKIKADSLGFELVVFREEGKSAKYEDIHNRPKMQKIIKLAEESKLKHFFVAYPDRIARNDKAAAIIFEKLLEKNGVTIYISQNSTIRPDDYTQIFALKHQMLISRFSMILKRPGSGRGINL